LQAEKSKPYGKAGQIQAMSQKELLASCKV
jgi:hypothetical protein